tara:strand:+ start:1064 stop:1318 length:255 start_codon:yes stop_codon:yes gene_type:complete
MSTVPSSLWLELVGQASQVLDLVFGANRSCQVLVGHNVHSLLPVSTLYWPSGHSVQTLAVVAAVAVEYVPDPQAAHEEELDASE